jgi:dTDP-4-dehydrorhamnose reductase
MAEHIKIWITGGEGFVGRALKTHLLDAGFDVVSTDIELSVCELDRLEAFAEELQPDVIINCAGIPRDATSLSTRVKAYETNALGAKNVALCANMVGAKVVQISSDDVYSSKSEEPVNEFDGPHPDTPYGKTKRAGEQMVRNTTDNHIIVRSSWLYDQNGGRLKDILQAASEGKKYDARLDQFAAPTSISTYAAYLAELLKRDVTGTFHIVSKGCASRYDFAALALEIAGYDPGAILVPKTDPKTAERVVLEGLMLEMQGVDMPTWEDDLRGYLQEVGLAKL